MGGYQSRGAASKPVVVAQPQDAPKPKRRLARSHSKKAIDAYLRTFSDRVWPEVGRYLSNASFPLPSAKVSWIDTDRFLRQTLGHLEAATLFYQPEVLEELLFPERPYDVLDTVIPAGMKQGDGSRVTWLWSKAVGVALAPLFGDAIAASLRRLVPRWVELAENQPEPEGVSDETKSLVAEQSLVPSHPMDLAVRRGLAAGGVLDLKAGLTDPAKRKRLHGFRKVKVAWQGDRDASLWNFVKPEPPDATPEEVAAALWTSSFWKTGTVFAHRLMKVGGLYAVPAVFAREFAAARKHAPERGHAKHADVAAASSNRADQLAREQAGHGRHANAARVRTLLHDSITRLEFIRKALAPWKLDQTVAVGVAWATSKANRLANHPHETERFADVIRQQHELLGDIVNVAETLDWNKLPEQQRVSLKKPLSLFARAAASSHLANTCRNLIHAARVAQTHVVVDALRANTNDMVSVTSLAGVRTNDANTLIAESRRLQTRLLRGGDVDATAIELTMLRTQEVALETRLQTLHAQVHELAANADELEGVFHEIVAALNFPFRTVKQFANSLDNYLAMVRDAWNVQGTDWTRDDSAAAVRRRIDVRQAALARAQHKFRQIREDKNVANLLVHGASVIKRQAKITKWVRIAATIAAMVGLSMVAGAAAAVVGDAVAGTVGAAEAVEGVGLVARGLRFVGANAGRIGGAANLATDVAVNSVGQVAMQGGRLDQVALDNALMTIASSVILGKLKVGERLELAKQVERETKALWSRRSRAAAFVLDESVTVSAHVVINIATAYVAHLVANKLIPAPQVEGHSDAIEDVFMQGATIGLGRLAHGRLAKREAVHAKLETLPEGAALRAARTHLKRLADAAERGSKGHDAFELLEAIHTLDSSGAPRARTPTPRRERAWGHRDVLLRGEPASGSRTPRVHGARGCGNRGASPSCGSPRRGHPGPALGGLASAGRSRPGARSSHGRSEGRAESANRRLARHDRWQGGGPRGARCYASPARSGARRSRAERSSTGRDPCRACPGFEFSRSRRRCDRGKGRVRDSRDRVAVAQRRRRSRGWTGRGSRVPQLACARRRRCSSCCPVTETIRHGISRSGSSWAPSKGRPSRGRG